MTTRKTLEPLALDSDVVAEMLAELDSLAGMFATYKSVTGNNGDPFVRATRHCGEQFSAAIARARRAAQDNIDA